MIHLLKALARAFRRQPLRQISGRTTRRLARHDYAAAAEHLHMFGEDRS